MSKIKEVLKKIANSHDILLNHKKSELRNEMIDKLKEFEAEYLIVCAKLQIELSKIFNKLKGMECSVAQSNINLNNINKIQVILACDDDEKDDLKKKLDEICKSYEKSKKKSLKCELNKDKECVMELEFK